MKSDKELVDEAIKSIDWGEIQNKKHVIIDDIMISNPQQDVEKLIAEVNLQMKNHMKNNNIKASGFTDNRIFGISESFIERVNNLVSQEDQLDILQEECAELIQACSKVLRDKPNAFDNLKEEMTHVLMSSAMVAKILGITQDDIDIELHKKAKKLFAKDYVSEKKVSRDILFEKYKERARCAYEAK